MKLFIKISAMFLMAILSKFSYAQQSSIIAGTGLCGDSGDGTQALQAEICSPWALESGGSGYLFTDTGNNRIRTFSPEGTMDSIPGGRDVAAPYGLTVMGDVFVTDVGTAAQLFKIDGSGNVTAVAGNGSIFSGTSGPALSVPIGLCFDIDTDGNDIYLVDLINNNLLKYDQSTTPDSIFVLYSAPSGMAISSIVINGDIAYLGGTNGIIEVDLNTLNDEIITTSVSAGLMSYNSSDGLLYVGAGSEIVSVNPATGASDTLWTEPVGLVQGLHASGTGSNLNVDYCTALVGSSVHNIRRYSAQPLPVELISFTGKAIDKGHLLFWETASELNNSHFEIQRSDDGQEWTIVGTMKGQGDSEFFIGYEFLDVNPPVGTSYYRLRQVDFDGRFEYSKAISLVKKEDRFMTLFPNPAKDFVFLTMEEKTFDTFIEIEVYSITGELQMKIMQTENQVNISHLKNGIYFLKIQNNGIIQMEKLLKY